MFFVCYESICYYILEEGFFGIFSSYHKSIKLLLFSNKNLRIDIEILNMMLSSDFSAPTGWQYTGADETLPSDSVRHLYSSSLSISAHLILFCGLCLAISLIAMQIRQK